MEGKMREVLFCLLFVVLTLAFRNITIGIPPSGPNAASDKHAVEQRIVSLDLTLAVELDPQLFILYLSHCSAFRATLLHLAQQNFDDPFGRPAVPELGYASALSLTSKHLPRCGDDF